MKILNNVSVDNQLTLEQLNTERVALSSNPGIGVLSWNDEDGTANLTLKGGSVVLQIGQEFHARVYNAETFTLNPGDVVYAYGAVNGHTSVKLANASSEATSRNTAGVITETIPPASFGFTTIMGKVRELDTSSYMPNETLYLSTADGQFTNIKPQSPDHIVSIGWVSEVSATNGSIRLNIHVVPNADEISYDNSDSELIGTNVKSAIDELQFRKADISLLSSNITLYTTNVASDIGGYYKLVSSVSDPSYNSTAVNITSGSITTTNQLINSFVATPNLFIGNPGYINITTIGNIRKVSGNSTQYAEFFFRVYKRASNGVETLISTSNTTGLIQNTSYVEFSATAILNNGVFVDTDRIVIKHFANVLSGSGSVYEFEFGGITPTRTLFPVPVSVIPSGSASSVIVDASSFNGVLDGTSSTIQSALNKIDDHTHDNRYYTETEINNKIIELKINAIAMAIALG